MRPVPRFSILTLLIVVSCAGVLAMLNAGEKRTIAGTFRSDPMPGAAALSSPNGEQQMVVLVEIDRGWPFTHLHVSQFVAADKLPLYINGSLEVPPLSPSIDYLYLTINLVVGLILLTSAGFASEYLRRRLAMVVRTAKSS